MSKYVKQTRGTFGATGQIVDIKEKTDKGLKVVCSMVVVDKKTEDDADFILEALQLRENGVNFKALKNLKK